MPYLGDYLGHLLSEIAIARMQGDIETVRIAELYAAHPLLRSMPVPHVRISDIDIEVPILIGRVEEPRAGESARGSPSLPEMRKIFDNVLTSHLSRIGVSLTAADWRELGVALDGRLPLHGVPTETSVDVYRLADDLSAVATRALGELRMGGTPGATPIPADHGSELKAAARVAFLELRKPPPRLNVIVTSGEIREAATTENLTRIRLRVSEQGVEWATIESEGTRRERLVPE